MKSEIFLSAIKERKSLKLTYGFNEIIFEPYYVVTNKFGKKVVFGRVNRTNEIKMLEFDKIYGISVLQMAKFSPLIPLMPV